jgi:excisionase family DNA binding protein
VNDSLRVETVASLAARLGLTRDAVVREVVDGRMPFVNVGGHWRFRESDVEYWMKHHGPENVLRVIDREKAESA